MSTPLVPSDSYVRFLVPPPPKKSPEHLSNIIPDYKITRILGSGGFATVYKAIGLYGKEVALKIPKTEDIMATMDMSVVEKFKSESDIWKKLDHSNIVRFYSGDTIPMPHIAMELMDGGSLRSLMKNHKLTVNETVHIMFQVLKGLSYAHRMATVHRDLKPENILFTSNGIAKITDWGVGKFMASASMSKTIGTKGTLNYCAPEQFDRKGYGKVDWQTDIFQIGIMFYEILTGVNPFAGENMPEIYGKVINVEPDPPSALNPDISSELDEVVIGALEKRKEARWDSGGIMFHELKRVIGGREVKVSRPEKIVWGPEPPKRGAVGNVCPQCSNVIALENKKLRCKSCKKFFCETCEGWIDKLDGYQGYEVKVGYPLCEDCYEKSYQKQVGRIDQKIREQEERKRLQEEREKQERLRQEQERKARRRREELERRRIIEAFDNSQEYVEVQTTVLVKSSRQVPVRKGIFKKRTEYVEKVVFEEKEVVNTVEMRTNSIGMKFVKIPGKSYHMSKYTVTQKEWKSVMGATPWKRQSYVKEGDDYPATYVSWNDCREFIKKLNAREGVNKYRLPTEDEWERTCRAGSTTKYCFGDDKRRLSEYAWYDKNAWDVEQKYAHKVGQKKSNQWGLYDMHGNVWEWTSTAEGSTRVSRGGCWGVTAEDCESSDRRRDLPDFRYDDLGVRLVRSSD